MKFECLMNPPRFIETKKVHRLKFALNETEAHIVPQVSNWATSRKWLMVHIRGNKISEDIIGQMVKFSVDIRDKSIYIIFDCLNGEPHVEACLNAHLRGDPIKVTIEETEAPYGLEKGTKRKTDWNTRNKPVVETFKA